MRDLSFAADMSELVSDMGFELGELVHYISPSNSDFNPDDGSMTVDNSPTEYAAYGFTTKYSEYDLKDTTILRTDVQLIVEIKEDVVPTKEWQIFVDSDNNTYSIESVQPIKVQGVIIAYRLQLRL